MAKLSLNGISTQTLVQEIERRKHRIAELIEQKRHIDHEVSLLTSGATHAGSPRKSLRRAHNSEPLRVFCSKAIEHFGGRTSIDQVMQFVKTQGFKTASSPKVFRSHVNATLRKNFNRVGRGEYAINA